MDLIRGFGVGRTTAEKSIGQMVDEVTDRYDTIKGIGFSNQEKSHNHRHAKLCCVCMRDKLTVWSRIFEKFVVAPVIEFPTFYGTVFTAAHH
jgi:hypothetical protein